MTSSSRDFNTFVEAYDKDRQAREKTNLANKYAIIDALDAAGIALVTVPFDGEGDSGQIEEVKAFLHIDADPQPFPDRPVKYRVHTFRDLKSSVSEKEIPLAEAIEDLCYGLLQEHHDGWENNDGAFGEFTFEVEERRVILDFNARFTDFVHSSHCF